MFSFEKNDGNGQVSTKRYESLIKYHPNPRILATSVCTKVCNRPFLKERLGFATL